MAAGGLGMAGGTAIIVGGGALFGTATSGTASAVLSKASKDETLDQCAQMLAYCKCILLDQQHSTDAIKDIKNRVVEEIVARTQAIAEFEPKTKDDKKQLKEQETCLEYIKCCNKELGKLIKQSEKEQ